MLQGDGTTTATVLAQSIVHEGMKAVAAGMNPMDLKRGLDKAVIKAVESLQGLSKPCADSKAIAQVAAFLQTLIYQSVTSFQNLWTRLVKKV